LYSLVLKSLKVNNNFYSGTERHRYKKGQSNKTADVICFIWVLNGDKSGFENRTKLWKKFHWIQERFQYSNNQRFHLSLKLRWNAFRKLFLTSTNLYSDLGDVSNTQITNVFIWVLDGVETGFGNRTQR